MYQRACDGLRSVPSAVHLVVQESLDMLIDEMIVMQLDLPIASALQCLADNSYIPFTESTVSSTHIV